MSIKTDFRVSVPPYERYRLVFERDVPGKPLKRAVIYEFEDGEIVNIDQEEEIAETSSEPMPIAKWLWTTIKIQRSLEVD